MEANRQPTVTYLRGVCFHITWKEQSYLHLEAIEKNTMEYFIQDPCFCSTFPAGSSGLCCHQRLWIIDKGKVDSKTEPEFVPCCLSLCLFAHSSPTRQKQTFNDTVNESVQAHDIGIIPACFPLKIKWRKMCSEATSFYLLVMVSEKITKLWQKRSCSQSWHRDCWIFSFFVFIVGHVAY